VVIPLVQGQATRLHVTDAELRGFAVKGWQLHVSRITPPDAVFDQKGTHLPSEADQPYVLARKEDVPVIHAILDWRYTELSATWTVTSPIEQRVKVRVFLRCQRKVAGSVYEVRGPSQAIRAAVRGNETQPDENYTGTDWFKGFFRLPFIWEDAGELTLPAGQSSVTMQPADIPWGSFFADVMALEIQPLDSM
jgi:hypothetical protein